MPHPGATLRALVKLGRKPEDCWIWLGQVTNSGHGKKSFGGRDVPAHRWLWMQLFGPIPDGLVVYSTCASKTCINPHHLACGTIAEAIRNSVNVKLLPADIAEIRSVSREDWTENTAKFYAEKFGVAPHTIREVWRGDSWGRGKKHRGPKTIRNQHGEQQRRVA